MNRFQRILRHFRKGTGVYLPNNTEIKIGDILSLESTAPTGDPNDSDIDMMGVVEMRKEILVLSQGHRYSVLPDADTIANIERYRFLGIKV